MDHFDAVEALRGKLYGGMTLIVHVVGSSVPLTFNNVHEESVLVKDGALIWERHPSRGDTCFGIPVERVIFWETEAGEE